jgi:dTMP kinase
LNNIIKAIDSVNSEIEKASVMAKPGVFICIEGIDASGKTTQTRRLVKKLCGKGIDAVYTTEPSSGQVGKLIRHHVLDREKRVPIAMEALLFAADRVDHLEKEVKPALKSGKVVVCDRYVYSTLAYQGAAGLDLEWIESINRFALVPDLALFLDVSPTVVLKRLKRKKSVMETVENQHRVRDVYMRMVDDGRLILVDGNKPVGDVASDVLSVVLDFLKRSHALHG